MFAPVATHREGDAHALHAPVLVLNASYEPINVCAARRALVLVLKGVAMTEEENGHFLHAARLAMRVPSVIRTGFSASQTSHPFGAYAYTDLGCRNATFIGQDYTFGHENTLGAVATFAAATATALAAQGLTLAALRR